MARVLEPYQEIERSITKKYRKEIWTQFIGAVQKYDLIQAGDHIAACISGGKDSMLLAKLLQLLQRYSEIPFEVTYLCMDPGYNPANRKQIEDNAERLHIPLTIFESDIFAVADSVTKSPCYLCARMRRGNLYAHAKELGCNKIALGHHFSDVIETTVMGMFYGSQIQGMMPKLHSQNFEGMELIRPMYCIHEDSVKAWRDYNGLTFLQCACRFTERQAVMSDISTGKRLEVKNLIKKLKETNPDIEKSIFNAIHAVSLDTFPVYKSKGVEHNFLEWYNEEQKCGAGIKQ